MLHASCFMLVGQPALPAVMIGTQYQQRPSLAPMSPNSMRQDVGTPFKSATHSLSQLASDGPISFEIRLESSKRESLRNKVETHQLVLTDAAGSHAPYTTTFSKRSNFHKQPHLQMYRNDAREVKLIGVCLLHHNSSRTVEIRHPWSPEGEPWEPQAESWKSEVGTLDGQMMKWTYHWRDPLQAYGDGDDDDDDATIILRCATVTRREEVCRVTMRQSSDADQARVEVQSGIITCQTALDELVFNAIVQFYRRRANWHTIEKGAASHGTVAAGGLAGGIMGGGGGC
ncbi:hypothetical protein F4780DRAFT_77728 [Xylariomycetidae sp. FL0641]|nr:hypothetical protein F4780DRAFT_77728 [Xylariomycetidae sp. FL0641]